MDENMPFLFLGFITIILRLSPTPIPLLIRLFLNKWLKLKKNIRKDKDKGNLATQFEKIYEL